jgi:RHS repeat-associated protein
MYNTKHTNTYPFLEQRSGVNTERSQSDAWGRPRTSSTLAYVLPNPFGSGSDIRRGYTFHEHLEEFNLINMNGRAYDPLLARFLNADPLIQDNTDAQNYNRYSYVLNNPTKYTDPSGYAYNGYEASNAAYQNMLEGMRYDMVMQQEMDFLSFKEMVKMNGNFGGGNGGTGNPSGIEGSGYIESDSGPYKIPDSERNEMKKNGMTPEYGMRITPRSGIAKDLGKVSEFCGNYLIPSDVGNIIGMKSTIWGGSATWTAAEIQKGIISATNASKATYKIGGNVVGSLGLGISIYNTSVKLKYGQAHTSDLVDVGASATLFTIGLIVSAPVSAGLVVVAGLGYGVFRIGYGDNADVWINKNFDFNRKK